MRAFRAHQRKQPARQGEESGEVKEGGPISQTIEANFKAQGSHRLKPERWRAAFDAEGRVTGFRKALKYIIAGGVDHSIRSEVWEFLLGCYDLGSTSIVREQVRQARRKRYKELIEQCRTMHVSVGTGTLAYTVGSKIMDVRITSKESATKMANQAVHANTVEADENTPSASPMDYEYQQPPQYDEWVDNSVAQSPVDFSFTSLTSPCVDNDNPFYSDLSETEADPKEVAHHEPLKSLIERDCETVTPRYSPGRIGPNSPNVLHAKFFQQSSSSVNKSLGRLKAKVQELQMKGVPYELRMAGMPSPNPALLQFSEERSAEWLWTLHKIVIDVVRTDRHLKFYEDVRNLARMSDILAVYAWIDPATGYCQGMSDLLSPFLILYENDADAFWCFESLLKRVRQNFQLEGPVGVMQQLKALPRILELTDLRLFRHLVLMGAESFLFAFRMLLLHFRRELPFPDSLRMWEMIWAADFDVSSCLSLDHDSVGSLHLKTPSMSLQQRLLEEDSLEYPTTKLSPYASPQLPSQATAGLSYRSRSPLCGLGPRRFWFSSQGAAARTLSLGRDADNDISVFVLAGILITNRAKFLKEARSLDDMIKMFNDVHFKIKVRTCIQTALKLRVAYRQQIARRSMAASP